jgi:hypothetical protein
MEKYLTTIEKRHRHKLLQNNEASRELSEGAQKSQHRHFKLCDGTKRMSSRFHDRECITKYLSIECNAI